MALIQWQDSFSLGIAEVDHEHKALIGLINDLHGSLTTTARADEIAEFLAELHASIAAHFALEERLMRQAGYRDLAAHKAEHEQLLDEIRGIMDDQRSARGADYERTLAERLREWFERHFRDADRRLHNAMHPEKRRGSSGP
jgi:hemerythrin